jgi:thiamine monophosphate kinase
LSGGEDYELLFTAPGPIMQHVTTSLGCQVTVVGEITPTKPGKVILLDSSGATIKLKKRGWDAFKK